MIERISLRPITLDGQTEDEQLKTATEIQRLVRDDFLRIGVDKQTVSTFVNPDDEAMVTTQIDRLNSAAERSVVYGGVYENSSSSSRLRGVVKIGAWTVGDAKPFGRMEIIHAGLDGLLTNPNERARGLDVFAVDEPELIVPTLRAVQDNNRFVPYLAPLRAAIHDKDSKLHAAFDTLGAPDDGPSGIIKLGSYAATYTLRILPPRFSHEQW